ncbi:MAG: HAD family hydrolase [Pseudomonadales bacterium]|nr:HAD family hydrolase [Pseudomonadales bacterium]NRA14445.1 HAD family hydrolase [Oceanospirillaceae bacterium]
MSHRLRSKTAWVFDLDGTLTNPVHDFAQMRSALGMEENADILQTIAEAEGAQRILLTEKLDQLEAHYAARASAAIGVEKLLAQLVDKNCLLGIFTRNTKEMALLSLQAIGVAQHFDSDYIIGRDEAPHKPNPVGLTQLLEQWQVNVTDAVMVGDFRFDLEAGRAAGTSTVHIAKDQQRWPELTDYYYSSLAELSADLAS